MRNVCIVISTLLKETQMDQTFNTPQFKKAFAGYTVILAVALMGAAYIRVENLPASDTPSFVGTAPAAEDPTASAPTF